MEYTTCATWRSHKADMEKFRAIPGSKHRVSVVIIHYGTRFLGEFEFEFEFRNSIVIHISLFHSSSFCLFSTEIYEIIHQCNITSSEMLRLIQNINFYIMFEVIHLRVNKHANSLLTNKQILIIIPNIHKMDPKLDPDPD